MNLKTLFAAAAAVAALAATPAWSAYPDRPIRLLVGYAPGGPVDTTARVFAKYLGDKLGQPVIVENRAGASGRSPRTPPPRPRPTATCWASPPARR